jgi:hypothetical protein
LETPPPPGSPRLSAGSVAAGESVGVAPREGRKTVRELKSVDWADYIHYGTDDFVLKLR